MKKVISILLALTVILASMVFATVTTHAANTADSIVSIAEGELGNTNYRKYSSYANAWCADFVSWCARQAGVSSIPSTASCYSMYNGMIANGCQEVSTPQRGDIVFFFCNSCSGTANVWCHVGIMVNSSTSIDGNYSGKVSYDNSYSHYGSLGYKHSSGISKIYVRPNYENPNFPGEEDTSWNVGKVYYANSRLNTYNSSGVQESGRWIDAGDDCYVEKVFKNGYAWVEYPSGDTRRWAYTLASGFSLEYKVPTGSQTISNGSYHIVSALDFSKGIDVATGSIDNGANINLYSNIDDDTQVFDVSYLGNGSYKIINRKSGKGLDCEGANTSSGTNVQQWEYVDEPQHQWIIQDSGDGESFNIISKKSGLYLDVYGGASEDGANIQVYTPNNSDAQKWRFLTWGNGTGKSVPEGDYRIVSALDNNMALDVYGAETKDEANIQLYSNLHSPEQTFSISYINNGYYKIMNTHSGKSLDLKAAKCISGTSIQQFHYENVPQQQWIIKPTSSGYYNIISKKGGLYLDVTGAEAKDQTNIQGYIGNDSAAQRWKLRRVLKDEMLCVNDVTIKSAADEIMPEIEVTVDDKIISQDSNYQVSVSTDIAAGKGTVTVTGINDYCDSVTKEFKISIQSAILGDADGDGEVSTIDVTLIQRAEALFEVDIDEEIFQNGDVNGDGVLDVVDATWLQRYLALMDVPFAIGEAVKTE
ncbi:RICIN domain-containing protein [Ruminococcus sp.]|uniref:RICIN domain-containing protein n=1 Tax=Ruminococcus sp. TaxID=41978 RepID=UPI00388DF7EC